MPERKDVSSHPPKLQAGRYAHLLLLQKHGVSLIGDTTNVQRVTAVRQNLSKVSGVATKSQSAPESSDTSD